MDEKLDILIKESEKESEHLEPMLARYAELLSTSNAEVIRVYTPQIIELCEKWEKDVPFVSGVKSLTTGLSLFFSGKFTEAVEPCYIAIQILEKSSFRDLFALASMIYGANKRSLGDLDVAVEFLIQGVSNMKIDGHLAVYKSLGTYQLAEINVQIDDYEAAERHYNSAVEIAEYLNNNWGKFRAYNGMANFYISQNKLEEAKTYLDSCMALEDLTPSQYSKCFCDLGIYHLKLDQYTQAEKFLKDSYDLRIKHDLKDAAATSLMFLCKVSMATDNNSKALDYVSQALEICLETKSKAKILECHHIMAKLYASQSEWEKSCKSYQEYDVLQNEINSKQLQNIYKQKNNQISRQKAMIEEAHKEITDSITYAKRIQSAILPSENSFNSHLNNAFVLYLPKDVVAGDFYWMEKIDDYLFLAAADCTGHGVPGAMVSVVCHNALNRSVREYGLTDPADILNKTREIVINEFANADENIKDGMDIALCRINGHQLVYAGAHNPLWVIKNNEFIEFKANKQPIGNFEKSSPFISHEITLQSGDSFYIFSDGYIDQFGGERGKKFKAKALKELLLKITGESMLVQKQTINDTFQQWKGQHEQVDDVCVIGVKV